MLVLVQRVQMQKLAVNGNIHAKEVKVDLSSWPDYVFKKEYELLSLEELEKYIKNQKHLPNIPSANKVLKEGIKLGEMNKKLLEKIEELTLHIIQQNKKIKNAEKKNSSLENRLQKIEKLLIGRKSK